MARYFYATCRGDLPDMTRRFPPGRMASCKVCGRAVRGRNDGVCRDWRCMKRAGRGAEWRERYCKTVRKTVQSNQ